MKLFTKKDPEQLYFGDYPVEIPKAHTEEVEAIIRGR